jgi:hypothetical protein
MFLVVLSISLPRVALADETGASSNTKRSLVVRSANPDEVWANGLFYPYVATVTGVVGKAGARVKCATSLGEVTGEARRDGSVRLYLSYKGAPLSASLPDQLVACIAENLGLVGTTPLAEWSGHLRGQQVRLPDVRIKDFAIQDCDDAWCVSFDIPRDHPALSSSAVTLNCSLARSRGDGLDSVAPRSAEKGETRQTHILLKLKKARGARQIRCDVAMHPRISDADPSNNSQIRELPPTGSSKRRPQLVIESVGEGRVVHGCSTCSIPPVIGFNVVVKNPVLRHVPGFGVLCKIRSGPHSSEFAGKGARIRPGASQSVLVSGSFVSGSLVSASDLRCGAAAWEDVWKATWSGRRSLPGRLLPSTLEVD